MPFCNNLRKDDPVWHVKLCRSWIVANQPRENSTNVAVILNDCDSQRYFFVGDLRLIVDGNPEDVAPVDGEIPVKEEKRGPAREVKPMDQPEQIGAFADELDRLCDRFAEEFDLSSAAAVGVLMMKVRTIQDDVKARAAG